MLRRDGSSRFATDHQWGTFYSVGGAWIFSDEKFIKNTIGSWLTHGKLRSSYGVTGNDKIDDYSYMTKYSTCTYPYEGNVGLYVNQLGNETLKWEETSKFDIGLELGFLTDRIVFNTSFYNNRSTNLLNNGYLPSQSGFSSMKSNLDAAVDNRGWEFELNTVNIKTNDFSWTTNFNISFPKNKLVRYENLESSADRTKYTIGKSINQVRMYKYTGVDNQTGLPTVEDVNGDGVINSNDDYQYLGTQDPKFYGGFNNTFTYRNLSLDVNFYFRNRQFQYGDRMLNIRLLPLRQRAKCIRNIITTSDIPTLPSVLVHTFVCRTSLCHIHVLRISQASLASAVCVYISRQRT